jgi:hypothetical protein
MNIKLAIKAKVRQSLVKIKPCKSSKQITSFNETKFNFVHFMDKTNFFLVYVLEITSCFSFIIHWNVLQFVEVVITMALIYEKTMFLGFVLLVFSFVHGCSWCW